MKKSVLMATLLLGFAGSVFAQSVTVDVPSGYKVVIVPSSVSVPQAVNVTTAPQTVYVARLLPRLLFIAHILMRDMLPASVKA